MKLYRFYKDLSKYIQSNKALIILGPRRVGKTTLLKDFLASTTLKSKIDSGDFIKTQQILGSQDFSQIREYVEGYDLVAIDEAQRIPNIGLGLKIIIDNIPGIKVIATGSSAFELSGQVGEPLTGRKTTLVLFPISENELAQSYNRSELNQQLAERLVWGSYPEVLTSATRADRTSVLEELVNSYLLKDILELEKVKGSKTLFDLLRLIAYQIGGEVSLSELGSQIGISVKTVARYLDLLEKSFVLLNLRGFSRNLRNEISTKSKYFFYDLGIRNAVINNFNALETRNDVGALWENFIIIERLKYRSYNNIPANQFFWRTWDGKEVDLVEERAGKLFGYECKYNEVSGGKNKKVWLESYPNAEFDSITKNSYLDYIIDKKEQSLT